MQKTSLSDEELISLIHHGDDEASNILAERYYAKHKSLLYLAGSSFLLALGESESNHAFFVAYLSAVKNFNPQKGNFRTYFVKILSHQIPRSLQEERRNPLGNALSLDAPVTGDTENSSCFSDSCSLGDANDPRAYLTYMEEAEQLGALPKSLDRKTLTVARLRIDGRSYEEIASTMRLTPRVVRLKYLRYEAFIKDGIKIGSFDEALRKYKRGGSAVPRDLLKKPRKKKKDD